MNNFKIVRTIEKNKQLFSAVPNHWEENNVLFWPDHLKLNKLQAARADAKSRPSADWGQYPCVVKCTNINNFLEAIQLEKQFSNCDTDGEEL